MVTLAFAVTSGWLAIAVPMIISIMRMAARTTAIPWLVTVVTILRGFISRAIGRQARGLPIIGIAKVMARA